MLWLVILAEATANSKRNHNLSDIFGDIADIGVCSLHYKYRRNVYLTKCANSFFSLWALNITNRSKGRNCIQIFSDINEHRESVRLQLDTKAFLMGFRFFDIANSLWILFSSLLQQQRPLSVSVVNG